MSEANREGCRDVAKWGSCIPKPLPNGTIRDKVAFLLKQGYQRSIKDIAKIVYPDINERSRDFKTKYSYIRSIVAKLRGRLVHFHRRGRYRLMWQERTVTLRWLIGYEREVLLGNGAVVPEWMWVNNFFNILEVQASRNGHKYVGGQNCPCTFEISRRGYVTVYVHDKRGIWEEWLEEELVKCGWAQGLVWHIFEHLEATHVDEHMSVSGFVWPRELKGHVIDTPYGWSMRFGDGSHPDALEIEFKENLSHNLKVLGVKIDYLSQMAGWVKKIKE